MRPAEMGASAGEYAEAAKQEPDYADNELVEVLGHGHVSYGAIDQQGLQYGIAENTSGSGLSSIIPM